MVKKAEERDLVQQIYDQISSEGGKNTTKVDLECNYDIQGKDAKHRVDIYWRFRIGEKTYSVIVKVKDYESTIDLEKLFQFKNVLNDLPGQPWGLFVTCAGYQEEALEYAKRNRILLYELRKPSDTDRAERITAFNITMHIYTPHFTNIKFEQDVEWNVHELARLEIPLTEASKIKVEGSDNLKFYDENDKEFTTALRFFNSLVPKELDELPPTKIIRKFDKPTFVETTSALVPRMKIKSVEFTISKTLTIERFQLNGEDFVGHILKNVSEINVKTFSR
ncbi:MAG: restriction endonuclease [Methanotrichaceae archaeon]|nr:restriction endonuclease [Methanotrichaceae archaeon]